MRASPGRMWIRGEGVGHLLVLHGFRRAGEREEALVERKLAVQPAMSPQFVTSGNFGLPSSYLRVTFG